MRFAPLFSLALLACGGKDDDTDDTDDLGDTDPTDTDGGTPPVDTYEATWAGMQEMFTDHCDTCHPSVNGIDLRVDIAADIENAVGYYVVPGDADYSLLWAVLATPTLNYMPQTGQLPLESVAHVEEWINSGASLD